MKADEDTLDQQMRDAVEARDENRMKRLLVKAMRLFLKTKGYTKDNLDATASIYLTLPIGLGWKTGFRFRNARLRYVFEELSAIEEEEESRARENVKRFLSYLKE